MPLLPVCGMNWKRELLMAMGRNTETSQKRTTPQPSKKPRLSKMNDKAVVNLAVARRIRKRFAMADSYLYWSRPVYGKLEKPILDEDRHVRR